ncbi:F-box domain containing protein [Tanacetum coccineum]
MSDLFYLPRDILIDILLRLPTKSLGQLKSVCKNWSSFISSASFVKLHHHRAIYDTNTNHSRVYIRSTHSDHSVNFESPSCYEGADDDDEAQAIVSLNNPTEKEMVGEKSLGACYGLVYFVCYGDCILLWNPTTQETRLIPDPPMSLSDGTRFYGLGYDFLIDGYKMVRASRSVSGKSISSEVFNLKTGSWRTVHISHIEMNKPDEIGIYSSGAVHWLVRDHDDPNKRDTILSFDLKDENFRETCLPNVGEFEKTGFEDLGDLKGCLYALYGGDNGDAYVWVMKEYGDENSWSMMIKLNWVGIPCDYFMTPICFTLEGEVVIDLDLFHIIKFNLSDKTYKRFKKCSTDWHDWLVYTETLVSPYG